MKFKSLMCLLAFTTAACAVAPAIAGSLIVSGDDVFQSRGALGGNGAGYNAGGQVRFEVLGSDRTIREVLQRWARGSGWTHDPVHWALQRDFPVQGTASAESFPSTFKDAARVLLSSTEGSDLPVQPCFYTNNVVRVVPQAEVCDRAAQ